MQPYAPFVDRDGQVVPLDEYRARHGAQQGPEADDGGDGNGNLPLT